MRALAIAAAALLGVALLAYACGLGVYAIASAPSPVTTEPHDAQEAEVVVARLGLSGAYPFEHRFALTPHGRMHYADVGSGKVVLCLHGNGSWSLACARRLAEREPGTRVIAPDLIGFGLSEKPPSQPMYVVDAHAADLAALVGQLDLHDVTVSAAPSTAAIAAALQKRVPDRVASAEAREGELAPPAGLLRLTQAPVLGELLVQGLGALSPGGARSPFGRVQSDWDQRASALALARATGS